MQCLYHLWWISLLVVAVTESAQVATSPTANIDSGIVTNGTRLILSTSPQAYIRYSLVGNVNWTFVYQPSNPLVLTTDTILYARAYQRACHLSFLSMHDPSNAAIQRIAASLVPPFTGRILSLIKHQLLVFL